MVSAAPQMGVGAAMTRPFPLSILDRAIPESKPYEIWREGNTWHAELKLIPEDCHSLEHLDEVDKLIAEARATVDRVYPRKDIRS